MQAREGPIGLLETLFAAAMQGVPRGQGGSASQGGPETPHSPA